MKRIFSRHALNVFELHLNEWPYGTHTHNFCELIFVKKGYGHHTINNTKFSFSSGDIFLLTPEDNHSFELQGYTNLLYIKFTEQVFQEKSERTKYGISDIFSLSLFHSHTIQGSIVKDTRDAKNLFLLAEVLLEEFTMRAPYSHELALELFRAIATIVVRQVSKFKQSNDALENDRARIAHILSYIRQHIAREDRLTLASIGQEFNISVHYVSEYLRKHAGKGLKKIITETRLERALVLLKQSPYSITEIAQKVGYSDLSHMNKMFRKYMGTSPSMERK